MWAHDDALTVRVAMTQGYAVALVEDAAFAVDRGSESNSIGLYVQGHDLEPRSNVPAWLRDAIGVALRFDIDQGWTSVVIRDREAETRYEHRFSRDRMFGWSDPAGTWFALPDGAVTSAASSFLALPERDWDIEEVEVTLTRGRTAGLVVDGDGRDGGLFLMVRPEHRDVIWWRLREGAWTGPIAGGPFTRPWQSPIKELVRLATRPLAFGGTLLVLCLMLGRLTRRPAISTGAGFGRVAGWMVASMYAIVSVILAVYVADELLERIPHVQDSVGYLFQAKVFAQGALWAPAPVPPDNFWHEFIVIDGERWFAKYPPGFPLILTIGVIAGAPWLVNPILAGVTILATYALGAHTWDRVTGLVAAGLLTLSPFAIGLSGSHMAHTAGLLLYLVFVLGYVRMRRGGAIASFVCGAAWGLDFLVRPWTAIVLALPFAVDAILWIRQDRRAFRYIAGAVLGTVPAFAVWFAYNAILAGHPLHNTMEMWWSFDRLGFGDDRGLGGHSPFNGLLNTLRNSTEFARHAFGWPSTATLAFAALPFLARRAGRDEWLLAASAACLGIGYWLWWADGVMYGPRFYFEAMGPIALLSARGIGLTARMAGAWSRMLVWVTVLLLIAGNIGLYLPRWIGQLRGYNYVNGEPIATVRAAGLSDAIVLVDPGRPHQWWNYGMVFSANDPWLSGPVLFARDLGPANSALFERYPDRSIYRLRGITLIPVSRDES